MPPGTIAAVVLRTISLRHGKLEFRPGNVERYLDHPERLRCLSPNRSNLSNGS